MAKALRNILLVSTVALFASASAHANISASLKTVCINATSASNQTLDKKINQVQKQYRAKLASYYKDVSCSGKTLLTHASEKSNQGAGTIAERQLLK